MISYLETWLPQIIGYAKLINGTDLWKVWVDKKQGVTSVTDFDELYEQIIGDLDSDNLIKETEIMIPENIHLGNSLREFLEKFHEVYKEYESNNLSLLELLNSIKWLELKQISKKVERCAQEK